MRKFLAFLVTSSLVTGLAIVPANGLSVSGLSQKSKITKPSAPTVVSIVSSAPKKGKVNVTVTITLPASNGGSKITGSKVTAGGKTCAIKKSKTSCTLKSIKNGKKLTVTAKSKNKKGFGPASSRVSYAAGSGRYTNTPTPNPKSTYAVGDTGPGGGIVYYVNNAGFSCGASYSTTGSPTGGLCKYLEVAPSGWNGGTDPARVWAVTANQASDVSGIANDENTAYNNALGIGLGYKNSDLIVAQGNDTTTAAGIARAYTNNSKTDWYLPTTAELTLLCQWNRGITQNVTTDCRGGEINTGIGATRSGFLPAEYWSSSEFGGGTAWFEYFPEVFQAGNPKSNTYHVRPVRAF